MDTSDRRIQAAILAVRSDPILQRDCAPDDFAEHTCLPTQTVWRAVHLFLGIDPDVFARSGNQSLWAADELLRLIVSDRATGHHLRLYGAASHVEQLQVSLQDLAAWARSHPSIQLGPPDGLVTLCAPPVSARAKPSSSSEMGRMYTEAVQAACELVSAGNIKPDLRNELMRHLRNHSDAYPYCTRPGLSDATVLSYIRKTGDPRLDPRVKALLTDK